MDEMDDFELDPRTEVMTAVRTTNFTRGLALLAEYQRELPADYEVLHFEDVDFGEDGGPEHELAGLMGLFAVSDVPEDKVSAEHGQMLETLGWFAGGVWQYRLTLYPKL